MSRGESLRHKHWIPRSVRLIAETTGKSWLRSLRRDIPTAGRAGRRKEKQISRLLSEALSGSFERSLRPSIRPEEVAISGRNSLGDDQSDVIELLGCAEV